MTTLADAVSQSDAPSALRPLAHVAAADRVWLLRLRGESGDGVEIWPTLDAAACRAHVSRNADDYQAYLAELEEDDLDETVTYRNSRGTRYETTVADVLDHVLLHASHHRGQVNAALREASAGPPHIDLIAWLRAGEPPA